MRRAGTLRSPCHARRSYGCPRRRCRGGRGQEPCRREAYRLQDRLAGLRRQPAYARRQRIRAQWRKVCAMPFASRAKFRASTPRFQFEPIKYISVNSKSMRQSDNEIRRRRSRSASNFRVCGRRPAFHREQGGSHRRFRRSRPHATQLLSEAAEMFPWLPLSAPGVRAV